MPQKDDRLYLIHIRDCCQRIQDYSKEGRDVFLTSGMLQDAIARNLEIIGEASKRVSLSFREDHPEIPWKQMAGMRDVLIHDYEGVSPEIVWLVVDGEIPQLLASIEVLLPAE